MASREKMRDYLCFTALEEGTFTLSIPAALSTGNLQFIEYSINEGKKWIKTNNVDNTAVTITTPTIPEGGKVYWRGEGLSCNQKPSTNNTNGQAAVFSSTCRFDVSGLLASLIAGKKVTQLSILHNFSFAGLFRGCTTIVNTKDLIVPKNVAYRCYYMMLYGCTSLISAPTLPALYLADADRCYEAMFSGCTNAGFKYMKMLAIDIGDTTGSADYCTRVWMYQVKEATTSVFVKHIDAVWNIQSYSMGVPQKWKIIYYDPELNKYYLDQNRSTECDDHGNVINA